jgi:hypothetical protein
MAVVSTATDVNVMRVLHTPMTARHGVAQMVHLGQISPKARGLPTKPPSVLGKGFVTEKLVHVNVIRATMVLVVVDLIAQQAWKVWIAQDMANV